MDGNDKCGAKEAVPQPRRRAGTPRCAAPARPSGPFCNGTAPCGETATRGGTAPCGGR